MPWVLVSLWLKRWYSSVLMIDPSGRVLAAGTPERVIRLWDPRVGEKTIGKLIGHSDCVRSIVMSEDGKHMLTGSSDSTIKLWSLAAHRCLHTFDHHTSSVWSLFSNHPNLERFYSGSRDGILCAVDVEGVSDVSDGECVVLSREGWKGKTGDYETKSGDEGVRCIVGMDDEFVWTATGSAEIKRWRDVGRRVTRMSSHDEGVSYNTKPNGEVTYPVPGALGLEQPFNQSTSPQKTRNGEDTLDRSDLRDGRAVAFAPPPNPRETSNPNNLSPTGLSHNTLDRLGARRTTPSGASIAGSVFSDASGQDDPASGSSGTLNGIPYESLVSLGIPDSPYSFDGHRSGDAHRARSISSAHRGANGQDHLSAAEIAQERFEEREVASEAKPLHLQPDAVIAGRPGLVRSLILNDRQHVLTVDTEGEVAVWNIVKGTCVGRFNTSDVALALNLERGVDPETAVRKHSVEVLEMVKDRIEGETMVITWCAVDTRIGSLVVHLEEGRVFDAEVYADESGVSELAGAREDMRCEWFRSRLGQR